MSQAFQHVFSPEFSMAHIEWQPGVQLRHFTPTCAVRVEDCVVRLS